MSGVNITIWFASYLNRRKQYIKITECFNTMTKGIKCGVSQGLILGLLLFLLYLNNLLNSSSLLVPIMFTDYTNIFFEHSNLNRLFKVSKYFFWLEMRKYQFFTQNYGKTIFEFTFQYFMIFFHEITKTYRFFKFWVFFFLNINQFS